MRTRSSEDKTQKCQNLTSGDQEPWTLGLNVTCRVLSFTTFLPVELRNLIACVKISSAFLFFTSTTLSFLFTAIVYQKEKQRRRFRKIRRWKLHHCLVRCIAIESERTGNKCRIECWDSESRLTVKASKVRMLARDQLSGNLKLRVVLLEGRENAGDELAGTSATSRVITEADDELLQLPNPANRHCVARWKARERQETDRDEVGRDAAATAAKSNPKPCARPH